MSPFGVNEPETPRWCENLHGAPASLPARSSKGWAWSKTEQAFRARNTSGAGTGTMTAHSLTPEVAMSSLFIACSYSKGILDYVLIN